MKVLKERLEHDEDGPLQIILEVAAKMEKKNVDPDSWKQYRDLDEKDEIQRAFEGSDLE